MGEEPRGWVGVLVGRSDVHECAEKKDCGVSPPPARRAVPSLPVGVREQLQLLRHSSHAAPAEYDHHDLLPHQGAATLADLLGY
ncbi:hypothetical protein AXF42_Ash015676 [Apostasia shenzhenica]|uniref:Uncharacterized protein n=1 Tax=Apostasia shenzhenica TaxID=1088818 RepID=A0A2H9ZU10_9ASPA|nr:hypothetical protein AXF42_Ash015676 [Apostasia shenzhenica]